jgi:hypothetical protein
LRYFAGFVLLLLAGLNALIAWNVDTCTGNAPDSLYGVIFTLPLNALGIAALTWNTRPGPLLAAASVPVLPALYYTVRTLELTFGYLGGTMTACEAVSDYGPWEPSGDELHLIALWLSAVAVFWLGLAFAGWRAYRSAEKDETVEQAR